jgi:hypothetical protein
LTRLESWKCEAAEERKKRILLAEWGGYRGFVAQIFLESFSDDARERAPFPMRELSNGPMLLGRQVELGSLLGFLHAVSAYCRAPQRQRRSIFPSDLEGDPRCRPLGID